MRGPINDVHACNSSVHGEALYFHSHRDHVRGRERRKWIELPDLTAISGERAHVEASEDRVAVHRAEEWVIQGCEDEIGRIYDELAGGAMRGGVV